MPISKGAYLKRLTSHSHLMRSVDVGRQLEGSSPPSVFIGSWNYPKVFAGPMIAPFRGDTRILDTPEAWIPRRKTQEEIIGFRLDLVRGKRPVDVSDLRNPFVGKLQEISLSSASIESEVEFLRAPGRATFSEEHTPYGASAAIERLDIDCVGWDGDLERVYYDTDLRAADAIVALHREGIPFSAIQKAFSVGAMGVGRDRRLVPTRWSITACDTAIADAYREEIRTCSVLDTWRVHTFDSLNNHYAVLLMPTGWQYEWIEAFHHILGREELVFADHEGHLPKTAYSSVGGCYYSCRMAILEALARERRQGGAIVLREARKGYVPLGVFNVRENVRHAMLRPGIEFEDAESALRHISKEFSLPLERFMDAGHILKGITRQRQTTLRDFIA
ncbi:MAG: hypothetical protein QMD46_02795 [Methanomicrobiales archaeon]|nr:hypothetical protein [Methanomicrobiales archaeon]MDI6875368.1 hypothetical protein [Methanomicrobiales archaeon]